MRINLPNSLTVSRIVMIFIFLGLAANAHAPDESALPASVLTIRIIAYTLAILAGITDLLDGYLARKYNQITDFGALMDPLADKIFVTATMLMCVEYNMMPAWIVVVVISREFLVTGLRMLAIQKGEVISADRWGKLKTTLQMIMLLIAGLAWLNIFNLRTDTLLGMQVWTLWIFFLCIIAATTVLSGMGYFIRYRSLFLSKHFLSNENS
ncbi:MAG: CDP-diacylglycerol--glycerol-3-phosphate 3-phosphatidyltransferase [Victivallaceae bacterium]